MAAITTEQRREWGMQGYLKRRRQNRERKERSEQIERDYYAQQEALAAESKQKNPNPQG
jgi:hypothetical protein